MIAWWNRNSRRRLWIFSIFLLGSVESGSAWLAFIQPTCPECSNVSRIRRSQFNSRGLQAKPMGKQDDEDASKEQKSAGAFGWFGSDSSKSEDDVKIEEQKRKKSKDPEASSLPSGLLKSISKRLGNRNDARKTELKARKDEKLAALLEEESLGRITSYLPGFDISGIASAIQNASDGFSQARDELRSVRADQKPLSEEEQRLEDLRKRTAAIKRKRLIAQQLADQRAVDRRETKKKEQEEQAATKTIAKERTEQSEKSSKDTRKEGGSTGEADGFESKRSNPLSVVQKFVSSVFDSSKDKEEWIVVAPKTRISPGEIVPVTAAGIDLLLVASKDGAALHCIANSCPHLGTPLEVGMLERRPMESSDTTANYPMRDSASLQETDIAKLLTQDGCEDCIVCPLHKTAFALDSGEVRGEWCPYPPVIGKVMGTIKRQSTLAVFDVRTKGKNIEVRLNTPFMVENNE